MTLSFCTAIIVIYLRGFSQMSFTLRAHRFDARENYTRNSHYKRNSMLFVNFKWLSRSNLPCQPSVPLSFTTTDTSDGLKDRMNKNMNQLYGLSEITHEPTDYSPYDSEGTIQPSVVRKSRFGKVRHMAGTANLFTSFNKSSGHLYNKGGRLSEIHRYFHTPTGGRTATIKSNKSWEPGDDVKVPFMLPDADMNMSFNKWPEHCFLRIRLASYYKHIVKVAVDRIKNGIKEKSNLQIRNCMSLPMKRKRWCYLSSPHIDKRSKDLVEIQEHVRILDVFPIERKGEDDQNMNFKGLLMIPLPSLVGFDYWFEETHKPVRNKLIHEAFNKRKVWISKYYLYRRDRKEKREIINKLTSAELVDEIPLKWKRHKYDFYALQLGELRKLYNTVARRKADDDAREKFDVKMPVYHDFGEVRFIGNKEDRMYDDDISEHDKLDTELDSK